MAGTPPAVDDDGTIYLATGNGTADLMGGPNRGQSFLKLRRAGATLNVVDWFTPFNYDVLEKEDRDLGSAGILLVPGTNLFLGGGKEGTIYVVDKNNLGKFSMASDNVVQKLSLTANTNPTRAHNHSTPVYWKSQAGEFIYTMAEEDFLKQWRVVNGKLELFKMSTLRAPDEGGAGIPGIPSYTMPGGTLTLSADGDKPDSGIIWTTLPTSKSANNAVVPGQMRAFAAADVSRQLWNSETNPTRDSISNYAKFNPVTVYNGRVYVPTFRNPDATNQFCVYGKL
jgi:hypothetical protein